MKIQVQVYNYQYLNILLPHWSFGFKKCICFKHVDSLPPLIHPTHRLHPLKVTTLPVIVPIKIFCIPGGYVRWVQVYVWEKLLKLFSYFWMIRTLQKDLYEQVKSYFNKTQTKTRTTSTNFSPKMQNNFQLMFRSFPKLNLKFPVFQRRWRAKPIHFWKGCIRV